MNETKLGNIIESGQLPKDAVHIAIAPVVADEALEPGEHIGFTGSGKASSKVRTIGVADPFLKTTIERGQCFWMLLYPGTITSLRHEWKHPAFAGTENGRKKESEDWIENCANNCDGLSYEQLMDAARDFLSSGRYLCDGARFEGTNLPREFWTHYEIVTGTKVEYSDRESFFDCSCQ